MTKRKAIGDIGLTIICAAIIIGVTTAVIYGAWTAYQEWQKPQPPTNIEICQYKGYDTSKSEWLSSIVTANHTEYIRCVKSLIVNNTYREVIGYVPANTTIPEGDRRSDAP